MRFLAAVAMATMLVVTQSRADTAGDVSALLDRWAFAYDANNPADVANLYAVDAVHLGTSSTDFVVGRPAVQGYFDRIANTGYKVVLRERRITPLDGQNALVVGFYDFLVVRDGKSFWSPSRYTMVMTRRDGVWSILHHHSSLRGSGR